MPRGPSERSVYQQAIGGGFAVLPPSLRRYFGAIPRGCEGVGRGVYEHAGYVGPRFLRPLMRLFAGRGVLFPDAATSVPFTVVNTPESDGSLSACRDFMFPGGRQRMVDAMTAGPDGLIVDRLGHRGGLEVRLRPQVRADGLRLRSVALALHVGPIRIPLPSVARVTVDERVDSDDPSRQEVDVRVRVRGLGEVFRYRGRFVYRIRSVGGNPVGGVVPPA